mgnify:CR=1 FL=1
MNAILTVCTDPQITMSRRASRRELSVYDIQASLGVPLSEPLVLSLLRELIKHLQYSRGQCCQLVDRMEAFYKVGYLAGAAQPAANAVDSASVGCAARAVMQRLNPAPLSCDHLFLNRRRSRRKQRASVNAPLPKCGV